MKANELRIGNIVLDISDIRNIIEIKISLDDFAMMGNFERSSNHVIPYKPIPITEQWLKRLGFEDQGKWHQLIDHPFCLNISLAYKETTFGHNEEYKLFHHKFVHQVQNTYFALTGKELEIK